MSIGLGIDTGGTYTDGVLYDGEGDRVLARDKSLTTPSNLSLGIGNLLDKLPRDLLAQVDMVSLSTTLATNACVEGKGSRCALFLLGYDPVLVERLAGEYGLEAVEHIVHLPGGHGQRGQVLEEPDWEALRRQALALREGVDALGICEYWGIRNPEYERKGREILGELGLPVVAGYELSHQINSMRRAATTALNARLIPLIEDLLAAVKQSLTAVGVKAPLMIVRGDGSLMTEAFAMQRPVETLLSGPAASVVGAMGLEGFMDSIILDVGGTTTDMAIARGGIPAKAPKGVDVGGWRTGTEAIGIHTIGLGGDSHIRFDKYDRLTLGPDRVVPLAYLCHTHPRARRALKALWEEGRWSSIPMAEFFIRQRGGEHIELTPGEADILDALAQGPLSLETLARRTGQSIYFLEADRLIFLGLVAKSALTPTDLMHIRGDYTRWDGEASRMGGELMAQRLNVTVEELIAQTFDLAGRKLYGLVAGFLLERAYPKDEKMAFSHNPALSKGWEGSGDELEISMRCSLPIVGIGAPAHIFLPELARRLGTECIIPRDAAVANAVGAITGSILAEERVVIRPLYEVHGIDGYACHSRDELWETEDYEEALAWAQDKARQRVLETAQSMGANQIEITLHTSHDRGFVGGEDGEELLLETAVIARGMGKTAL